MPQKKTFFSFSKENIWIYFLIFIIGIGVLYICISSTCNCKNQKNKKEAFWEAFQNELSEEEKRNLPKEQLKLLAKKMAFCGLRHAIRHARFCKNKMDEPYCKNAGTDLDGMRRGRRYLKKAGGFTNEVDCAVKYDFADAKAKDEAAWNAELKKGKGEEEEEEQE